MITFIINLGHHHQQHCNNFWQQHCLCNRHHINIIINRSSSSSQIDHHHLPSIASPKHEPTPAHGPETVASVIVYNQRLLFPIPPTTQNERNVCGLKCLQHVQPLWILDLLLHKLCQSSRGDSFHLFEWCSPTCCSTASAASHTLSQCSPAPEKRGMFIVSKQL